MALGGSGGGSSRAIEAGRAFVRLFVKDDAGTALGKIAKKFADIGKAALKLTGIGAILGAVIGGLSFKETVDDLARMNTVAKAFGVNGRAMSGLLGVLGAAGGEFKENLEGIIQFATTVDDAVAGKGEQGAALFDGLAVKAKEVADLPIDEKFYAVLGAIREIPQELQESKLALLGGTDSMKQWQKLLTMSKEDIRQMANDLAISSAELDDAARASEAMGRAQTAVNRAWQQVVIALAPAITNAANGFTGVMKEVVNWLKGRTLQDLWDEAMAWVKVGWTEADIFIRNGLAAVWDFFVSGWDAAVLLVKNMFIGLGKGIATAVADAVGGVLDVIGEAKAGIDAINPFQAGGLDAVAGNLAKGIVDIVDGQRPGGAEAKPPKAKAGDAMRAGVAKAFDGLAADAGKEFDEKEQKRKDEWEKRKAKDAADRAKAQADLERVQAEIAARRQARMQEEVVPPRMKKAMAELGKAMGTFGGVGSFLTSGFGSGSGNVGKELVKGQKLGNDLLKMITDKLDNTTPFVFT